MKIAQLTPGSGDNFYCENCLRDAAMVKAMRKNGHDVFMVPMYLPATSQKDLSNSPIPVFFGGINVYLQQKLGIFRKTPRWIDKLFDSPKLLGWVGKKASMTTAKDLAETTISMLKGHQGKQIKELNRLIDWLDTEENRPDAVCLSNLLLAGLAETTKQRLNVPVLCLLQDEDGFLDGLGEPYAKVAWEQLKKQTKHIDAFVSVSKYYAGTISKRLELPEEKMHVINMGINLEPFKNISTDVDKPVIGYLSRMCNSKGLDTLVEAFIILKKKAGLENIGLRIAGGKTTADDRFIRSLKDKLKTEGMVADVDFWDDTALENKKKFFEGLSVLSVPEKDAPAYGLYVIESLAAGVPVVEPDVGVFTELIETTGGGVLYRPNTPDKLAETLEPFLRDKQAKQSYGSKGREAVFEKFDIEKTCNEMAGIYEKTIAGFIEDKNA